MLLIIGTIWLPASNLALAKPIMTRMIKASRAEHGCLGYSYAEDVIDTGLIHVVEVWVDRASLDQHFSSTHIAEWRSHWPALGITDRKLTAYEVTASGPI